MTPGERLTILNAARERRANEKTSERPDRLGEGWTARHIDGLLELIAEQHEQLLQARAKVSELAAKLAEVRRAPDALYDYLGRDGHLVVDEEGHPWTPPRPLSRDDVTRLYALCRDDTHSWVNGRWG